MSKNPFALMTLAALLAACTAAAQDAAHPLKQTTAEPALLGAPLPAPVPTRAAVTDAPEPVRAAPAPRVVAAHNDAAVTCDVRTRRSENGIVIQARALADRDIDGEYDLVITKSGGGNSSEINQSGPVSMSAGSAVTLGENEISVERGARLRAVLILRDADGTICRQSFTL